LYTSAADSVNDSLYNTFYENSNNPCATDHLRARLDPYWIGELEKVTRPAARALIPKLRPYNALGIDAGVGAVNGVGNVRGGALLQFFLEQKQKHPLKVLLVRVGDFYESYGVDAGKMLH